MAVDPGKLTGIAIVRVPDAVMESSGTLLSEAIDDFTWVEIGELGGPSALQGKKLAERVRRVNPDQVVFEDFQLRTQHADLRPVEVTFAFLGAMGWSRVQKQMPSAAKSAFTNQRLKALGCYRVGSDHERDAIRHALLFISKAMKGS